MHKYLEVKLNSLAAEASEIKRQERRVKLNHAKWKARGVKAAAVENARSARIEAARAAGTLRNHVRRVVTDRTGTLPPDVFFGLRQHRLDVVRPEARASHLALGFLRGHEYSVMEGATTRSTPNWKRVEDLVKRFGQGDERDRMQRFSEWKAVANGEVRAQAA